MKFNCPHCTQRIEADDSMTGSVVECPTCCLNITIPQPEAPIVQIPRAVPIDDWSELHQSQDAGPLEDIPPTLLKRIDKISSDEKERQFRKKRIGVFILLGIVAFMVFRSYCGIFVVQPIGAIPDGGTIIYWRSGLNMPFISSADGLLQEYDGGVSLLGRGVMLAGLTDMLRERKIISLPYSKTLYLWSTGGRAYDR